MAGKGTGYPISFVCPVARRNRMGAWEGRSYPAGHDRIVRTGRTKPAPGHGHGHPRKLSESHEYRCECGNVGWTSHADVLRYPVEASA